ncbi:hypothetical protein [Spiroplasma phoeniceum]|uniref:Uncharacterized protein n=1 Tax=Spiroplasma phoeniceum P40 TaxID=1276259 RepID=A0A345DSN7_9MOLU|nr:hypothetical protein [Spiroplasma phoeniceum]AXF97228.1 hypothetical protein SDAV_003031 [Spiroplasma phoeniceum P40]
MRRASYIDTKIDYDQNDVQKDQRKEKQWKIENHPGRLALKQWEKHWKSGWFENLTKEKQKEYKLITNKLALDNKKFELVRVRQEWKRNWYNNLDKEKQREYKKGVEEIKKEHNL